MNLSKFATPVLWFLFDLLVKWLFPAIAEAYKVVTQVEQNNPTWNDAQKYAAVFEELKKRTNLGDANLNLIIEMAVNKMQGRA